MTIVLRPRQVQAITDTRRAIAQGSRAPILVAPTGAGKTVIAAGIIQGVLQKKKTALFLAHRKELIDQARNKLRDFGIDSGIIKAGKVMALVHPVQVASVQTLVRRMDDLPFHPDLIMIDECHLSNAATYQKIIDHYKRPLLIGLTATPQRLDGSGLGIGHGGMFDTFVSAGSTRELIDEGHLCRYRYYAPLLIDAESVHTTGGEFDQHEQEELADRPTITGDFIKHWKKYGQGRPTIVATVTVRHAEHVAEQARAAGIRAVAVSGKSEGSDRDAALAGLASGAIEMVSQVSLWIEGVDCPPVSCVVWLTATKSLTKFRQFIGRGMRTHPGKDDLLILDHAGNCMRHGLPDSDIEWTLEGRKRGRKRGRKKDIISLRTCPECFAAHVPTPTCPACGHVYEVKPRSGPEAVDGELQEITAVVLEKKMERREVGMAKTREQLQAIARKRGYKSGWVDYMLKARAAKGYIGPVSESQTISEMKGEGRVNSQAEFYKDLMARQRWYEP